MGTTSELAIFNHFTGGILLELEDFSRAGLPPSHKSTGWKVKGFTRGTKKRLITGLRKHRWSNYVYETSLFLPYMCQPRNGRDALKAVIRWLNRNYPNSCGFYVLEFKDDTPHYHFLIDFKAPVENPAEIMEGMTTTWDKHCSLDQISRNRVLAPVKNLNATCNYLCKEDQKDVPSYVKKMSRFWGKFGKLQMAPSMATSCSKSKAAEIRDIVLTLVTANGARYGYVESLRHARKVTVFLRKHEADMFDLLLGSLDAQNSRTTVSEDGENYYVECADDS